MTREELEKAKQKAFDEICSLGSLPCKDCFDDGFKTGVIAGIRYGFTEARKQKTVLKENGGYWIDQYVSADQVIAELGKEQEK